MWFCCISLHLSSGIYLHYRQFSSCCLSFPTPASCSDWRDFSWAQPCLDLESETAQCSSVYVAVSPPDGIKMSLVAPSRVWGLFGLFPRYRVSRLCRFLSQSGCGCWFFCLQLVYLPSGTLFALTHHIYACVHVMVWLSDHKISIVGLFL